MKNRKLLVLGASALLMLSGLVGCSNSGKKTSKETPEEILERVKGEIGSYYGELTKGIKGNIDLLTEVDGVSITYTVTDDAYFEISEDGTTGVAKPLYIGDTYTKDGEEVKVDDSWYATTVLTATLSYQGQTAEKKFNVKIVATARVQTYTEYMAVANNGAACVQAIIDVIEYEPKYGYNVAWGHDKDGNPYYFYNFADKYIDDDKVAVGNEIVISGTKSIYNGYHELIKFDSVLLVSKGNAVSTPTDVTAKITAATTIEDKSLEPLAGARISATNLVVTEISDPTEYYVEKTDTVDAYLNKYFFKVTAGEDGTEYQIALSRYAEGDAALAKAKELKVDDVISIEDCFGEWYNGFQFTVIDATKITKTGSVSKTPAQKIEKIKSVLEDAVPAQVTETAVLPVSSYYSSTITWSVGDATNLTLGADGKTLTAVPDTIDDKVITLTGTITIPGQTETGTFTKEITVPQYNPSSISIVKNEITANNANAVGKTVTGKVILIQGTTFYIDDGYSAIMIYNCPAKTYTPTLGDVVSVTADFCVYNGLFESASGKITEVKKVTDVTITDRAPFQLTASNWNETGVKGYDCGLVCAAELEYVSTTSAAAAKSTNGIYVFKCGETTVTITVNKYATECAAIAEVIAGLTAGDKVKLTNGAISMYKGTPQVDVCNASSITKIVTE